MSWLRRGLDRLGRRYEEKGHGGMYPLYEAVDTLLYTSGKVTAGPSHVRDGLDLKRMMGMVVLALVPCMIFAMYNTGHQAALIVAQGGAPLAGWQSELYLWLGLSYQPDSLFACFLLGALYFVPVLAVTFAVGGGVEVLFAVIRKHEVNEGFFVTGFLIPLIMPPGIPLWEVALGTAFGVFIGKEIFGGTGMNFLNPALTARAYIFFAYPQDISGDIWAVARFPDGLSGATPLASLAEGRPIAELDWSAAFLGDMQGSMGETSALLCLVGALLLIITRIGSWRTMAGVTLGTIAMAGLLNLVGSDTNPMFGVPFWWHMVLGGWAFGTVFMATDPVSSAFTERGKWIYGFAIGAIAVVIRCINPAYPEGMMLSILFMNMFAPLIDHYIVQANIKRRKLRYGRVASAATGKEASP